MPTKAELQSRIESVRRCKEIQCDEGNWNYSDYMRGMANAFIFAMHILDDKTGDVEFFDIMIPPEEDEFPELAPIAIREKVCTRAKAV